MTLNEFLVWLTSGGSIIFVSWIAERWAWFQSKSADVKQWIIYGASVVLSIGAYYAAQLPASTLVQLAPIFLILSGTFISIFVGKMFHSVDKQ